MKHLRLKAAALAAALALLCAGCGAPASSAPSSSGGVSSAPASSAPASSAPAQETAALGEYRAMWVSYLEWESFDFSSEAAFAADADEMMQNCADMGLNVVIAQVRPFADALYPSELFPWSHLCTGVQGQDPGFDPLAILLDSAHSHGLELEAWLNPYRVRLNATRPAGELSADNPAVPHPEWVKTVGDGVYFDPSLPAVRQLITDGVVELLQNYPELDRRLLRRGGVRSLVQRPFPGGMAAGEREPVNAPGLRRGEGPGPHGAVWCKSPGEYGQQLQLSV